MNIFQEIDLSNPLKRHSLWRNVHGVLLPCPQLYVPGTAMGRPYYPVTVIRDLSGMGNHATKESPPQPVWQIMQSGVSSGYGGTDDHMIVNPKISDVPGPWDWSVFVVSTVNEVSRATSAAVSFGHESGGADTFVIYPSDKNVAGATRIYWEQLGGDAYSGDQPMSLSETRTILFTSRGSNEHVTFINGIKKGVNTSGRTPTMTFDNMWLGGWSGGSQYFSGNIFMVAVFKRGLTDDEAMFLHRQSLAGYPELIRRIDNQTIAGERISHSFYDTFNDTPGTLLVDHTPNEDASGLGWKTLAGTKVAR